MTLPEVALMLAGWLLVALAVSVRTTVRGAQARRWLRRVWRDLWPCLASALLWGLAAAGCGPSTRTVTVPASTPGEWRTTLSGTPYFAPAWLLDAPALRRAKAETEIDETPPEAHPAIPPGTRGAPPGWRVVIREPGAYYAPSSPTKLATGHADLHAREIHAAWGHPTPGPGDPLLPSYAHELAHAWVYVLTGDYRLATCAGHPCGGVVGGAP